MTSRGREGEGRGGREGGELNKKRRRKKESFVPSSFSEDLFSSRLFLGGDSF